MKTKLIFFCLLLCGLCSGGLTAKQDGPKPRFYPARYGQGMYNNSFDGGAAFPLPVSINPSRGTVEIWFTMKEDLKPYYGYRTLFSVQNLDAQGERQNCISLVITPKDGYYEESLKFTVVSPQGKRHDIYLKSPAWKKANITILPEFGEETACIFTLTANWSVRCRIKEDFNRPAPTSVSAVC